MTDFKSKYGPWTLVAGASEGIGAAFSEELAKRGMNLILIARRIEELSSLLHQIHAFRRIDYVKRRLTDA